MHKLIVIYHIPMYNLFFGLEGSTYIPNDYLALINIYIENSWSTSNLMHWYLYYRKPNLKIKH